MSGFELTNELQENMNYLNLALKELKKRGRTKAESEHDYKVKQAQKIYVLREEGHPVTIISDLVKGSPEIAELRKQRDLAKSLYESCLQAIYSYKIKIGIVERQIQREYNQ